jgi:hypothetical protein
MGTATQTCGTTAVQQRHNKSAKTALREKRQA